MRATTAVPDPGEATISHRYDRESMEFGRVVNLSDAVFAIALTLLVLTLDSFEVAGLVSFGLAFLLVANVWWQHHRILAQVAWLEPGLIGLNLVLLAGVALVPLPTSLVGNDPTSQSAVLPFIGLFILLSGVSIAMILRVQRLRGWRRKVPVRIFRWVLIDWLAAGGVLVASLLLAIVAPLAALVLLAAASSLTAVTVSRLGPQERRVWLF